MLSTRNQKSFFGGKHRDGRRMSEDLPEGVDEKHSTVRFHDVEVREYSLIASDNPGVKAGVAIEVRDTYRANSVAMFIEMFWISLRVHCSHQLLNSIFLCFHHHSYTGITIYSNAIILTPSRQKGPKNVLRTS